MGYQWKNKEANFGLPIENQVAGGTHITFEIILKIDDRYVGLRRPKGIPDHELPQQPNGLLYFCHNLIRYGERVEACVKRIVKDQAGVDVVTFRVVDLDSEVKDNNWAITPHVIAEIDKVPETNNEVREVVVFSKDNAPEDLAWWSKEEIEEFLKEFD